MASVGLLPAAALVSGGGCGLLPGVAWTSLKWALASLAVAAWIAWWGEHSRVTVAAVTVAFFCAAVILAAEARDRALLDRWRWLQTLQHEAVAANHLPLRLSFNNG